MADTALLAADGCFYAIEESQTKAYIADLETEHRATALGVYSSFTGLLYLPASLLGRRLVDAVSQRRVLVGRDAVAGRHPGVGKRRCVPSP